MADRTAHPDPGGEVAQLADRLAELETRVRQLEANRGATATTVEAGRGRFGAEHEGSPIPLDPEVFWALEGVRSRSGPDGGVLMTGSVALPTGEQAEWQEAFASEALLEADWSLSADSLTALSHPVRLQLLREVARGARTASELSNIEGLGTTGQLYHHLRQLVSSGWLRTAGRGQYQLPATKVVPLLVIIGGTQP